MKTFKALLWSLNMAAIFLLTESAENDKPSPTITRTELRVGKNLKPEDTQTLNVMTRDGGVAQLIVKRRDPKSKLSSTTVTPSPKNDFTPTFYSNWIPVQSVYLQPNLIRLDTFTLLNNGSGEKSIINNIGSNGASDRIHHVPKPVTVRSSDIFVQPVNDRAKKGRSLVEIDTDGIPIVHGVRVPDDETDEKVWRNARVINGELVPYEKGYKPPAAVPVGQLVYASKVSKDPHYSRGVGPFTTTDNFHKANSRISYGPFTVKDNHPLNKDDQSDMGFVKFSSSNTHSLNSKLINYLKEINAQESRKDYFSRRKLRSYDNESQPQIQRRMLDYGGTHSYPNSALYSSPSTKLSHVNFNEGVRTPILQYAHPELGVQPAKASKEEEEDYEMGSTDNEVVTYGAQPGTNHELKAGGRFSQTPYYTDNINSIDYYKKDVINYPYNQYYLKTKTEQPFWVRLTETIRDNVQSGFETVHQLTRPVFEPIVEATHKITHNLGLARSPARVQDKVGIITPMAGSIILPALGLVAGGAALGLGAAAVGRFLQPEEMRAFQGVGYPNDILVIMEEANTGRGQDEHRRVRRSLETIDDQYLQELGTEEKNNGLQHLASSHLWSDTPCSKKIFCEAMVRQNPDEILVMEKKMDGLLSMVHPSLIESVSYHLQDVMNAIKRRDCSQFRCSSKLL